MSCTNVSASAGKVRLGIHRLTKTKVAVKIVDKADLEDDNLQKITREIEIMRRLSHPAIIRLYQVSMYLKYILLNIKNTKNMTGM